MSTDPVPGDPELIDPELIRGVLQRYSDIGDAAEKALTVLKRDGAISVGRGSAIDQLREKIGDDLPDKLAKTARSYQDAAAAYWDYIPRLQEAQDIFDRAVQQARNAAPQANLTPPAWRRTPPTRPRRPWRKRRTTSPPPRARCRRR